MSALLRNPSLRSNGALCCSGAIPKAIDPHADRSSGAACDPGQHRWDACAGYGELGRSTSALRTGRAKRTSRYLYERSRPWADPASGLVALATGGTPLTTGVLGSDGYDRALSPAGSHCRTNGAPILIDTTIEYSDAHAGRLDPSKMPLSPQHGCTPVFPHDLLHVNNIFEVVKAGGDRTAWAGESAALTDLYQGPSGRGLDEACGFEHKSGGFKDDVAASIASDNGRVAALLHWIDG
jgi:hypothetical protein